jgi:hypothetical protein
MAEAVNAPPGPPASRPRTPHGPRFLFVYLALAAVAGAGAAAFFVLVERPAAPPRPTWSDWQPTAAAELERARQIATFVSRQYRLSSGSQLVGVRAVPPTVQNVPITAIALQTGPGADDIAVVDADKSIVYILCGLGDRCSIKEGKATLERGRLVRREALELALYTFTYVDEVDKVIAFLPPPKGKPPTQAVFFQRGDLDIELSQPLNATLEQPGPFLPETVGSVEASTIDRLTAPREFTYEFQALPDNTAALVLAPFER